MARKHVAVLVGGGDCPGLNAVIRAVARRYFEHGWDVVGIREGWHGLVDGITQSLGPQEISGNPAAWRHDPRNDAHEPVPDSRTAYRRCSATSSRPGLDALVAVGGEDTLGVAARLYAEHDFPVVGVPKTIDNDLSATDYTVGFDTAVFIATEAIDRLHTTAERTTA